MNTTLALTCAVTGGPSLTVITRNDCLDSSRLSCQQVELPSSSLFTKQISAMGLEALILWPESQDIIERGRDGSAGWIKGWFLCEMSAQSWIRPLNVRLVRERVHFNGLNSECQSASQTGTADGWRNIVDVYSGISVSVQGSCPPLQYLSFKQKGMTWIWQYILMSVIELLKSYL